MTCFTEIHPDEFAPGPYSVVAGISLLPEDLAERCGITFHEVVEDLGLMDIAFVELPDGERYILQRYRDAPVAATQVFGIKNDPDLPRAVGRLFECMGLDQSFLFWIAGTPDA